MVGCQGLLTCLVANSRHAIIIDKSSFFFHFFCSAGENF